MLDVAFIGRGLEKYRFAGVIRLLFTLLLNSPEKKPHLSRKALLTLATYQKMIKWRIHSKPRHRSLHIYCGSRLVRRKPSKAHQTPKSRPKSSRGEAQKSQKCKIKNRGQSPHRVAAYLSVILTRRSESIVKQMPKSIIRGLRRGGADKRLRGEEKRKEKWASRMETRPFRKAKRPPRAPPKSSRGGLAK